jgi:undecaprenyl diphosphate synthase
MALDPMLQSVPAERVGPVHVAIIMDGNGRWAVARGLSRGAGHRAGVDAVERTVEAALDLGVQYLTLYGFSTENWRRPVAEVTLLMQLLRDFLLGDMTKRLDAQGVRIRMIGDREGLARDLRWLMKRAEEMTASNTRMTLTIALNYGARQEMLAAAKALVAEVQAGRLRADEITEDMLAGQLMTAYMPDPDLLVRTSGERRISNFLLWQSAYTEFVFVDTLWPDFGRSDLELAVREYLGRDRRYGAIKTG